MKRREMRRCDIEKDAGCAAINNVHAKNAKKTQRTKKSGLRDLCVAIFAISA